LVLDPRLTVWLGGETEMVKSAETTSVTEVEWILVAPVPVMVRGYDPAGVEMLVVTEIVELPDPVTDVGLKVAPAPEGNPLTVKPTLSVNPFKAVTVAEKLVLPP
jgi:hypothetical protein